MQLVSLLYKLPLVFGTEEIVVHTGSNGFVNYNTHAQAVHAIVAINGQMVGDKALKCGWGQLQPRQPSMHTRCWQARD